jgi:hypothetical protein
MSAVGEGPGCGRGSDLRELVERKIAEFIEDSSAIYARYREAVARANALPLMFDWLAFMALRPDGHVVLVPCDDEPGPIEVVLEERVRNIGLQGNESSLLWRRSSRT